MWHRCRFAPNARAILEAYGSAASDPVEKSVVNSTFFSLGRVGGIRTGAAIIHLGQERYFLPDGEAVMQITPRVFSIIPIISDPPTSAALRVTVPPCRFCFSDHAR